MGKRLARTIRSVLLVDDFELQLNGWEREFKAEGKRVLRASNRKDAAALAQAERPDVAVVDLFLAPPDTGLDVIEDLKSFDPKMYVVLVSAHASVEYAVLGMRARADDVVSKPFRAKQLLSGIEQCPSVGRQPETFPTLDQVEWEHIARVLHDCDGNITHAAEALKIHRQSLQRKIRRHAPRVLKTKQRA